MTFIDGNINVTVKVQRGCTIYIHQAPRARKLVMTLASSESRRVYDNVVPAKRAPASVLRRRTRLRVAWAFARPMIKIRTVIPLYCGAQFPGCEGQTVDPKVVFSSIKTAHFAGISASRGYATVIILLSLSLLRGALFPGGKPPPGALPRTDVREITTFRTSDNSARPRTRESIVFDDTAAAVLR